MLAFCVARVPATPDNGNAKTRVEECYPMSMNFKRHLPMAKEVREELPLSAELAERKAAFDAEVAAVMRGEDPRRLLIIGPCSADREDSVLDYMHRLAGVADEVKDKLIVIPRVYTNKPRTKGTGYKGLLHNPDPEAPADLLEGIIKKTAVGLGYIYVVRQYQLGDIFVYTARL